MYARTVIPEKFTDGDYEDDPLTDGHFDGCPLHEVMLEYEKDGGDFASPGTLRTILNPRCNRNFASEEALCLLGAQINRSEKPLTSPGLTELYRLRWEAHPSS